MKELSVHLSFEFHSSDALVENASWLKAFLLKETTQSPCVVPLCDKVFKSNRSTVMQMHIYKAQVTILKIFRVENVTLALKR